MGDLTKLIARVEALTGADREVDFRLHIALVEDAVWPAHDMKGRLVNPDSRMSDYLAIYADVIKSDDQDFDFPRYTASLDAAMALAVKLLDNGSVDIEVAHRSVGGRHSDERKFADRMSMALQKAPPPPSP